MSLISIPTNYGGVKRMKIRFGGSPKENTTTAKQKRFMVSFTKDEYGYSLCEYLNSKGLPLGGVGFKDTVLAMLIHVANENGLATIEDIEANVGPIPEAVKELLEE